MSNLMSEGALSGFPELPGDVPLDADDRAVLLREMREQMSGFGFLVNMLANGKEIPRQMAYSVLYMAESRTDKMCKLTGIELDSMKVRDERYARIRSLNEQVRALKDELGKGGSVDQTSAHLKVVYDKLNAWWDRDGFGHISEFSVSQYGNVEVKFSCTLFGDFRITGSDTPVSDKELKKLWHASLQERGFEIREVPSDRDPVLVDCDKSRQALEDLFSGTFPSAEIVETTNHHNGRGSCMVLKDVRVLFRDMQEIVDLPLFVAKQGQPA